MAYSFVAGIVTYNPDINLLMAEIDQICKKGFAIIVIDNASKNIREIEGAIDQKGYKLELVKNPENLGIAKAHNQILGYAKDNRYTHAITFDQDSVIPDNLFDQYSEYTDKTNIGVLAPKIDYVDTLSNGKKSPERVDTTIESEIEDRDWVIASASMVQVKAWEAINGFDEKMFIDLVDRDFCIRLKKAGYSIIRNNNVILRHNLGELERHKLLGRIINVENHNSYRKYYIARNYIYLMKKKELEKSYSILHVIQLMIETLLYEKDKTKKVKAMFNGVRDGIKM